MCEKFGFLGGGIVLILFMVMVVRIFMIARMASRSDYGGLICVGVGGMLIVQILHALFGWPSDIFSTFSMMLAGLVAMLVVADVCWPLVPYRKTVLMQAQLFLMVVHSSIPHGSF